VEQFYQIAVNDLSQENRLLIADLTKLDSVDYDVLVTIFEPVNSYNPHQFNSLHNFYIIDNNKIVQYDTNTSDFSIIGSTISADIIDDALSGLSI
jgi:hypothetical protein